jgi:hypothetical protein
MHAGLTQDALTASQKPISHKHTKMLVELVGMDQCHHDRSDGARTDSHWESPLNLLQSNKTKFVKHYYSKVYPKYYGFGYNNFHNTHDQQHG